MVDNKSKTSLIRHIQKNNITLMKITNIILVLCICILSSFMIYLYPQTKVGDILDSGLSRRRRRRRRRRRNFLVDAITQKQINIFFSNLVHMLRVPKGRSLF